MSDEDVEPDALRGNQFNSRLAFKEACNERILPVPRDSTLAKVYAIDELYRLSDRAGVGAKAELQGIVGVNRRYQLARVLNQTYSHLVPKQYETDLFIVETETWFPIQSYFSMTDDFPCEDVDSFLSFWNDQHPNLQLPDANLTTLADPLSAPSRVPDLQAVRLDRQHNEVVLVFAMGRTLPDPLVEDADEWAGAFFARVPIVVRLKFDSRVISASMPAIASGGPIPVRFSKPMFGIETWLKRTFVTALHRVSLSHLFLYLEQECGGVDKGWHIKRDAGGILNVEQSAYEKIDLPGVLTEFQEELSTQCEELGLVDPLSDVDFYALFRGLRKNSHVYSMLMEFEAGVRDGKLVIQARFGEEDSADPAILEMKPTRSTRVYEASVANAISAARDLELEDPHELHNILAAAN